MGSKLLYISGRGAASPLAEGLGTEAATPGPVSTFSGPADPAAASPLTWRVVTHSFPMEQNSRESGPQTCSQGLVCVGLTTLPPFLPLPTLWQLLPPRAIVLACFLARVGYIWSVKYTTGRHLSSVIGIMLWSVVYTPHAVCKFEFMCLVDS